MKSTQVLSNKKTCLLVICFFSFSFSGVAQDLFWTINGTMGSTLNGNTVNADFTKSFVLMESDSSRSTYLEFTTTDSNNDPVYVWLQIFPGPSGSVSMGARSVENPNQDPFACDIFPISAYQPFTWDYIAIHESGETSYSESSEKCGGSLAVSLYYTIQAVGPAGYIDQISGDCFVVRDEEIIQLELQDPIFMYDLVETSGDGTLRIAFVDESSIEMHENAKLFIDEYVFDPTVEQGGSNFTFLRGLFMYVSGLIGREDPDSVAIDTPVGSLGIRGTEFSFAYNEVDGLSSAELSVISGLVEFRSKYSSTVVDVAAGETFSLQEPVLPPNTVMMEIVRTNPLTLSVFGNPDQGFFLQQSPDLKNWVTWKSIFPENFPLQLTITNETMPSVVFFRASDSEN